MESLAAAAESGGLDFHLPAELEAREPPEARGLHRDEVRLLVSRGDGQGLSHARFLDLPSFLRPGDLLVANDSATIPAALVARRANGAEIALHLSSRLPADLWTVEPRRVEARAGERLELPAGGSAALLAPYPRSRRLWVARLDLPTPVLEYLAAWGHPITYGYVRERWPIQLYQTVFAREPGSAEMPSAGRPFTIPLVQRLARAGVGLASITLHTGVASLELDEQPYEEPFHVPPSTAQAVATARRQGGRVIAVGTTVVRALESAADDSGRVIAARGWSDLVVTPERGVRVVDGLITGFHEPKASHLRMLEAIAGRARLGEAYRAALEEGYRWHEFGDSHLILPNDDRPPAACRVAGFA